MDEWVSRQRWMGRRNACVDRWPCTQGPLGWAVLWASSLTHSFTKNCFLEQIVSGRGQRQKMGGSVHPEEQHPQIAGTFPNPCHPLEGNPGDPDARKGQC